MPVGFLFKWNFLFSKCSVCFRCTHLHTFFKCCWYFTHVREETGGALNSGCRAASTSSKKGLKIQTVVQDILYFTLWDRSVGVFKLYFHILSMHYLADPYFWGERPSCRGHRACQDPTARASFISPQGVSRPLLLIWLVRLALTPSQRHQQPNRRTVCSPENRQPDLLEHTSSSL